MRSSLRLLVGLLALLPLATLAQTRHITVAAAADLHHALDDVVASWRRAHPDDRIDTVYGASGKLVTQIEQGAPFELFFSADSDYPKQLEKANQAGGPVTPYAMGHLVLWSGSIDMKGVTVADLAQPRFGRIALANPEHAPYGKRAKQALEHAKLWQPLQGRLVIGENIAQAAQYAQSGNAQVGLIAESLTHDQSMAKGSFVPVPESDYEPLQQSFVLTAKGRGNALATAFADYVRGPEARTILAGYGFRLPAR